MYLIRRKCHVVFDRTEKRYVRAKFSLAVILTGIHVAVISSPGSFEQHSIDGKYSL